MLKEDEIEESTEYRSILFHHLSSSSHRHSSINATLSSSYTPFQCCSCISNFKATPGFLSIICLSFYCSLSRCTCRCMTQILAWKRLLISWGNVVSWQPLAVGWFRHCLCLSCREQSILPNSHIVQGSSHVVFERAGGYADLAPTISAQICVHIRSRDSGDRGWLLRLCQTHVAIKFLHLPNHFCSFLHCFLAFINFWY